jgi:phage internal scaffolding protein
MQLDIEDMKAVFAEQKLSESRDVFYSTDMRTRFFRRPNGSLCVQVNFHDENGEPLDPVLVDQSVVNECDINTIIDRFRVGGAIPSLPPGQQLYGDFTGVTNFHDAQIRIFEATELFNGLPAKIRYRFDNDPGKFLTFANDPENQSEMVSLGLVEKPKDPVSAKVETSAQSST